MLGNDHLIGMITDPLRLLCRVSGLLIALVFSTSATALDTVNLQLKWQHSLQFAGYYAAEALGFYRDAGLAVNIKPAPPGLDIVQEVVSGRADFATGTSSLLLARHAGQPVVVLAVIFQHSPYVLIASQRGVNQSIHDLRGNRIMMEPWTQELQAYLQREGLPPGSYIQIEHSHEPMDLIDGKVDAIAAYTMSEPYFFDQKQFNYQVYTPRSAGIDFYGDNLFTSERVLSERPALTKRFRQATLRGWEYALTHPEELIRIVYQKYPQEHSLEYLRYQQEQIQALIRNDLVPLGYMHVGRWQHMADVYAEIGMLPHDFDVSSLLYRDPGDLAELKRLSHYLIAALVALGLTGTVVLFSLRANRQIRQSELRYRILADNALDVISIMNLNESFSFVSPSMRKLLGYSPEEALEQSLENIMTPHSLVEMRQYLQCLRTEAATGKPLDDFRGEIEQRRKDGSTVWTEVSATPITASRGEVTGVLSVTRDISSRKSFEEDLVRAANRYGKIISTTSDGFWTVEASTGRILDVNQVAVEMSGYTKEELLTLRVPDLDVQHSEEDAHRHYAAIVQSGSELFQTQHRTRDDRIIDVEVSTTFDPQNGTFVAFLRDITERVRHEHELQRARDEADAANAAKSRFLANMSHEIRTPMNGILGLAQVLERDLLVPSQRELVARIREAGRSLLGILNDILDFSKIEAGQLTIAQEPFALGPLLRQIDSLLGETAREKQLTLELEVPARGEEQWLGDALRVEQVLMNLIGNAIKFTEKGRILVRTGVSDEATGGVRVRFEVVDTGIGITPEQLSQLFTPFMQADGSITRRFGGTGLGLSISQRLAELMGGTIEVESVAGQGSTFWVELPFAKATATAYEPLTAAPSRNDAEPRLVGRRCLVVDDSPLNRIVVERMLEREGAEVTLATEGVAALGCLDEAAVPFDLVLMDMQMPVMDGLTATRRIREDGRWHALPVIALSAGVLAEQREAARQAGCDDFLPKPVDLEALVAMVSRWTERGEGAGIPADWPVIPGLDLAHAYSLLECDREFLLGLIASFVKEFRMAAEVIDADLKRGADDAAAARLRALSSAAEYLGAQSLLRTAQILEEAIRTRGPAVAGYLAAFSGELAALIMALDAVVDEC